LFFLERYYSPRAFNLDELLFLAAHVIRNASHLAKDWIGGLAIAVCAENGTPEFIQRATLDEIWDKSRLLSANIEGALREPLLAIQRGKNQEMLT
jgi:hypothetical protein